MNDSMTLAQQNHLQLAAFQLASTTDKLVIVDKDRQSFDFPLEKAVITIGRARDNDVVLTDYAISRYHVRLERHPHGWVASDIGSTNGVVIASRLLTAGNSSDWAPNSKLLMGPYTLRWEHNRPKSQIDPEQTHLEPHFNLATSEDRLEALLTDEDGLTIPQMHIPQVNVESFGDEPPEIEIRQQQASVYDDQSATLSIAIQNRRGISDSYQVDLVGLPNDWVVEQSQRITLDSLAQGIVKFVVRPTLFDTMSSSEYPFRIQASSISKPSLAAATSENLTVMPRHQFMTKLSEERKPFGSVANLGIQNIGTAADFFEVKAHSDDARVSFESRHWNMALAPHTMDNLLVGIKVDRRPWLKQSAPITYTMEIHSKSGLTRQHHGSVVAQPRLNSTALIVCLMLVLLAVVFWSVTQLNGSVLQLPLLQQIAALNLPTLGDTFSIL